MPTHIRGEMARPGLIERLSLSEAALIAVLAPSGYGKSTLAAQWLRSLEGVSDEGRVAWFNVSADTGDLESFYQCLERVFPGSPLPRGSVDQLARWLDTQLPCRLVFDEAHHLSHDSQRFLTGLVPLLPAGVQFTLLGYDLPAVGLPRLVAGGHADVLGLEDLAFGLPEVVELCSRRPGAPSAHLLWKQYEGWPLAVSLATFQRGHLVNPEQLIAEMLGDLAQDFPPGFEDALTPLSVESEWTAALAPGWPGDWLEVLRRRGLPLTPVAWGVYRPHTSLQAVLDSILRRKPELYRTIHLSAAQNAQARQAWQAAIDHYLKAGQFEAALEAAQQMLEDIGRRGSPTSLQATLELFDFSSLPNNLKMRLVGSWMTGGQTQRALDSISLLRQRGERDPDLLCAVAHHLEPEQCIELHQEALELAQTVQERLRVLIYWGDALWDMGRYEQSLTPLRQALALHDAHPEAWTITRTNLLWHLIRSLRSLERFDESAQLAAQMLSVARKAGLKREVMRSLNMALQTEIARGTGSFPKNLLTELESVAFDENTAQPWVYAAVAAAHACLHWNDLTGARHWLSRAQDAPLSPGAASTWRSLAQVELSLHESDRQAAEELLGKISHDPEDDPGNSYRAFLQGWLLLDDQPQAAAAQFAVVSDRNTRLQRTIRQLTAGRGTDPGNMDESAEHFQLNTFGGLKVSFGRQSVRLPLARAGELLALLALNGEQTREQLVDALWDGNGDERHVTHFKVLVRRLRQALQNALPDSALNPLEFKDGKYLLSPKLTWRTDALILRDTAQNRSATPQECLEALNLAQTDFLPSCESQWAEAEREELRILAVNLAQRLAAHPAAIIPQQEAALRHWCSLEPYSEEAHRQLSQFLSAQGDEVGAKLVRQQFDSRLKRDFM